SSIGMEEPSRCYTTSLGVLARVDLQVAWFREATPHSMASPRRVVRLRTNGWVWVPEQYSGCRPTEMASESCTFSVTGERLGKIPKAVCLKAATGPFTVQPLRDPAIVLARSSRSVRMGPGTAICRTFPARRHVLS